MKITYENLLSYQSDNNLIDMNNEVREALQHQLNECSPLGIRHFSERLAKIIEEMIKRGLA